MFGHDSKPSRIYSYGAKPPAEGAKLVDAQMELARRYRNALVRVERKRRERVDEALRALSPDLIKIEAAIAASEISLTEARTAIDQASALAREKVYPPGATAAANAAHRELKRLYEERKAVRQEIFASPTWKPIREKPAKGEKPVRKKKKPIGETIGEKIDERAAAQGKRLYAAARRAGLSWGTCLFMGGTVNRSGPPPQFSRWDGDGHLAVQVQHGITPAEAFAGQDTRVQIEPLPVEEPPDLIGPRLSKAAMRRTRVRFRVGSDASAAPVFAVVPVVLHRPMPWDAQIKWVHLIRRRIGTHCEWRVQFVLSRAIGWGKPDCAAGGQVQIDVGWRVTGDDGKTPRPDGSMRVAYWKGSDGAEGELMLPADLLSEMRKTEDIQSIRDRECFNPARDRLAEWLRTASDAPAWLRERTATLPQWRSPARLAALVIRWRDNRFGGDLELFEALEAWRKRDKHLLEYEENLRDQLQRRRENIYRNFAAKMRRTYRTAKVEKLDLRDFHELPEAEDAPVDGALKEHVRDACLSALFRCVQESMAETVKVSARNTTAKCHVCGSLQTWNHKVLRHTCTVCGAEWDQDANAAGNIGEGAA
jgi:GH24 family phage-related lysozyme (muramidase)